jgi:manganese oxidase
VLPASMTSVDMIPRSPGNWLLHCHVDDHMMAGMSTRWNVAPGK